MKLVIAVVQLYDTDQLLKLVTDAGLRATRIVSTGGFLRMQNATVLLGVEDGRVAEAVELVRAACRPRVDVAADATALEFADWMTCGLQEVTVGGGVVFILPISRALRIPPAPNHIELTLDRVVE